jgi:hypothetical protein
MIESSDIIETGQMIFVGMRKNYSIEVTHFFAKHLETKIRTGIDHQRSGGRLYQNAGAESLISRIPGGTDTTITSDHGNAATGAGSQKTDLQGRTVHARIRMISSKSLAEGSDSNPGSIDNWGIRSIRVLMRPSMGKNLLSTTTFFDSKMQ